MNWFLKEKNKFKDFFRAFISSEIRNANQVQELGLFLPYFPDGPFLY